MRAPDGQQEEGRAKPGNQDMKDLFNSTICGIVLLAVFIGVGTGILVWLSPVAEE